MEKITHTNCPLCKSDIIKSYLKLSDYSISKEDYEICKCGNCNFLFTQRIPAEHEIGAYYISEDYISHSDTQKGLISKLYHFARKIMLNKKYRLIKKISSGKDILDIGCGTGYFLNHMKQKGYETLGVEVSEQAREFGKQKFGLNILPPDELLNEKITGQFKIITLWHVLEHLFHPEKYLQTIFKILDNDGVLILALPNPNCYDARFYKTHWAGYDVPRHIWHFTPETINRMAIANGFEIKGYKRLPFDSFYNSLLSEKYLNNKAGLIRGAFNGFLAYCKSLFNIKTSSSIIYILKKQ